MIRPLALALALAATGALAGCDSLSDLVNRWRGIVNPAPEYGIQPMYGVEVPQDD